MQPTGDDPLVAKETDETSGTVPTPSETSRPSARAAGSRGRRCTCRRRSPVINLSHRWRGICSGSRSCTFLAKSRNDSWRMSDASTRRRK